jgi:hypothetical protein
MKLSILPLTRSIPTAIWCGKAVLEPVNGIKMAFGLSLPLLAIRFFFGGAFTIGQQRSAPPKKTQARPSRAPRACGVPAPAPTAKEGKKRKRKVRGGQKTRKKNRSQGQLQQKDSQKTGGKRPVFL